MLCKYRERVGGLPGGGDILLAWGREATPSRGNRKCKGREDRSMVSGGGQDSLTSKARPCAAVVSERTRLPVLELQLCHFPAG